MPHYKDGTAARVGDTVRGKPYNTPYEITGVLISITPSADSNNCLVAFAANLATQDNQSVRDPAVCLVGVKVDAGETKAFERLISAPAFIPPAPFSAPANPDGTTAFSEAAP